MKLQPESKKELLRIAGGTANSVNGLTFAAQTTDPGAGSALTTNKVLIVYV